METESVGFRRAKQWIDLFATVMMIVATGAILWVLFRKPAANAGATRIQNGARMIPVPSGEIDISNAPRRGRGSQVVFIEYSDFQCPYCGKFARETQPIIDKKYVETGQLDVVFMHLPLERIHPLAFGAAAAAECAHQQGKFWPMLDSLFANQESLDDANLKAKAAAMGLDVHQFAVCGESKGPERVRANLSMAKDLGIIGTPGFLIGRIGPNGKVHVFETMNGARPVEDFERTIESVLKSGQ